jgi:hypothetical protein
LMSGSIIFFLFFIAARAAFRGPSYQHRLMDSNFFLGLARPREETRSTPGTNITIGRSRKRMYLCLVSRSTWACTRLFQHFTRSGWGSSG